MVRLRPLRDIKDDKGNIQLLKDKVYDAEEGNLKSFGELVYFITSEYDKNTMIPARTLGYVIELVNEDEE